MGLDSRLKTRDNHLGVVQCDGCQAIGLGFLSGSQRPHFFTASDIKLQLRAMYL